MGSEYYLFMMNIDFYRMLPPPDAAARSPAVDRHRVLQLGGSAAAETVVSRRGRRRRQQHGKALPGFSAGAIAAPRCPDTGRVPGRRSNRGTAIAESVSLPFFVVEGFEKRFPQPTQKNVTFYFFLFPEMALLVCSSSDQTFLFVCVCV